MIRPDSAINNEFGARQHRIPPIRSKIPSPPRRKVRRLGPLERLLAVQHRAVRLQVPPPWASGAPLRLGSQRPHFLDGLNEVRDEIVGRTGGGVQPELAAVLVEGWGQAIPSLKAGAHPQ